MIVDLGKSQAMSIMVSSGLVIGESSLGSIIFGTVGVAKHCNTKEFSQENRYGSM